MQIGGIQKTSMLDFPDRISAIVFTHGCNFRCGYCHNPELIIPSDYSKLFETEFFEFLMRRQGKLDGVVITGGEPCLQKDLIDFICKVKDLGFEVKLDTNGYFPAVLKTALKYVDYVAMDIKAPLGKYADIVHVKVEEEKIKDSIKLIMQSGINYEFRTTVIKSQLSFKDFENIGRLINGAEKYYLQKFVPSKILDKELMSEKTYSDAEFEHIKDILSDYVKDVFVRGL